MTVFTQLALTESIPTVFAAKQPDFDLNTVTPGVIGFIATFLIIVAVVLLVIDMVRRIRRTQYRAEIGARLDAEEAAATSGAGSDATNVAGDDSHPVDPHTVDTSDRE